MANLIGVEIIDKHLSITLFHGCGDALDETFVLSFLNDKTVHNDLNIMILVAIHLHACNDLLNDTIHAYIKIALATYGVEEFLIVTLAILNERSQQINLFAHEVLEEKIQNLLLSILHHPFTCDIRESLTHTGIEETEEIINLCACPYCRTGILVRGFLLDTDDRGQT